MPSASPFLTITPLGGLGEIGLNCMTLETEAGMVILDCGLMFPSEFHPGVDIIIPRFEHILRHRQDLLGIVLTHGHEDHIGALPWLLNQVRLPVYASPFTLALVEHKLKEHGLSGQIPLHRMLPGETVSLGDMRFHFFPVSHSIIDGYAVGIESPVGRILHSGDFKLDPEPLEEAGTDLPGMEAFAGKEGLRLLMADSTNVEREGHSLSERQVLESLGRLFTACTGRILVTLFSSNIQRIQEVFDCAGQSGRKVAVIGRSLVNNIEIASKLGRLRLPASLYLDPASLPALPDEEMVLLVTGSQGEPMSALSRIATGEHRHLAIHRGDTVLMSSRLIPGNTMAVNRLINTLYRQGAEVFYESVHAIHASGHANKEELATLMRTVRPEYFIPVHGEYRHLVKNSRLACECGISPEKSLLLEDGQPVTLLPAGSPEGLRFEEPVDVESILVDGKGVGDVVASVLRERQLLGGDGLVVLSLILDGDSGEILRGPELSSRGFVLEEEYRHVLEEARDLVLDLIENSSRFDEEALKERVRSVLRRFFRKTLGRDPVVIPVLAVL